MTSGGNGEARLKRAFCNNAVERPACRRYSYRRSSLTDHRMPSGWRFILIKRKGTGSVAILAISVLASCSQQPISESFSNRPGFEWVQGVTFVTNAAGQKCRTIPAQEKQEPSLVRAGLKFVAGAIIRSTPDWCIRYVEVTFVEAFETRLANEGSVVIWKEVSRLPAGGDFWSLWIAAHSSQHAAQANLNKHIGGRQKYSEVETTIPNWGTVVGTIHYLDPSRAWYSGYFLVQEPIAGLWYTVIINRVARPEEPKAILEERLTEFFEPARS